MTLVQSIACDVDNDPAYGHLKQHIIGATGLAYYMDKDPELSAQIGRRMAALRIVDCRGYLDLLTNGHSGDAELDELAAVLTIGETFFFRHLELFNALRDRVLPELIDRNQRPRRLRIWSAGCAIGAEPYSLAVLLRQSFGHQLADWDVSIVGTDINRAFLSQAVRGEYSDWSLRSMPDESRAACFVHKGQSWVLRQQYHRGVSFQYHNLVQHPFPSLINDLSAFDLILCRNVMIYFEPSVVRRLVGQFHDSLVEGGWFAVGPTEPSVATFRAFETLSLPDVILYRKGLALQPPSAPFVPAIATDVAPPRPLAISPHSRPQSTAASLRMPASCSRRTIHPPAAPQAVSLDDIRMQLNRGRAELAEECCRTLLAKQRLNPSVHFYLALAVEQQGRYADSEQALRRAIYLDRDLVLAHYHLGLVLHRNRDARVATRCFRNVLALLHERDANEPLVDADGLTVGTLRQLTEMQLEVVERP